MKRCGPIRAPELGADIRGLAGNLMRVPRRASFQADADVCLAERNEIIDWCAEQGIELARIDMARKRQKAGAVMGLMPLANEQEWEVFVLGDDLKAVVFKTRWG